MCTAAPASSAPQWWQARCSRGCAGHSATRNESGARLALWRRWATSSWCSASWARWFDAPHTTRHQQSDGFCHAMTRPVVLHVTAVEFTASRLLRPQLQHLAELGYDVRIACAPEGVAFSADLRAFHPVPIAFPRSSDPVAMAKAAATLLRCVGSIKPALIHFHSPAASLPGRVALAVRPRQHRVVYTVHGFLHTWDSTSRHDRILERVERLLSRRTDALLFQSTEDYERARAARYHGLLVNLGNGVSDQWFQTKARRARAGPLRAVFVGRLTREKGVGELLSAARQIPDVQWTIIGDSLPSDRDPAAAEVARLARESNGRVRWVGMVSSAEVRRHLAEADLLVLPSWREGMPRSVIEGMAAGLPVVACDIRGCRELVEPGVNGWLVPARNATALANAIASAAALPWDDLAAMGGAGRRKAWQQHRERAVFDRIAAVYRQLGVAP
jgi:glycosyltransferase involved in cell wall biosynthesis